MVMDNNLKDLESENGVARSCSDMDNKCENFSVDLLEDLDSYMQDINDRLTISRMVNDSVIKGMVTAVQQEAVVEMAQRQLEVAALKKMLLSRQSTTSADDCKIGESPNFSMKNIGGPLFRAQSGFPIGCSLDHETTWNFLENCRFEAMEQFVELRKQLMSVPLADIDSSLGLSVLDSTQLDKSPKSWSTIEKGIDALQATLCTFFDEVENMVHLSKLSHYEFQQELEFQAQVEAMVIANCIRSVQEQFVEKLSEQNARCHDDYNSHFPNKWKEQLSNFCQELDALNKLLSVPDSASANLVSHGSLGGADNLQRKLSGSLTASSLREGASDKHKELIIRPENLDPAQLKHLSHEDLVGYFKTEMTKMKRNHESKVQQMTEEFFTLKREYLKERGSPCLPNLRKDRDFDGLKRKISEVIVLLNEISKSSPTLKSEAEEGVYSMQQRLDALSSENLRLKDMLSDEQREVRRLLADVSNAENQNSFYHQVEVGNLKRELEDAKIKALMCEDVQCCFIKGLITDMLSVEDMGVESAIQKHVNEALCEEDCKDKSSDKSKLESLDVESIISYELTGYLFANSLREARKRFDYLSSECICEKTLRVSLEKEVLDKQKLLEFEAAEKERLELEKLLLAGVLEEKDSIAHEMADQLAIEKKQVELAKQELDNLRSQAHQHTMHVVNISKELDVVKVDLTRALEQNELYKDELRKLNEALGLVKKELHQNNEERRLLAVDIHDRMMQAEENERVFRKQLELTTSLACGFMEALRDMEDRANKTIKRNNLRFEGLGSELTSLGEEADRLKRWGLMYKQKFERKCSDLEKAENEVDALADEVETLLRLLENVYVALDHYSPILQHYPGVVEILKMVRRELSGEYLRDRETKV